MKEGLSTFESSVLVSYITITVIYIERSPSPRAVTALAFGAQNISIHADLLTALLIASPGQHVMVMTSAAGEPSVVVSYFSITVSVI